MRSQLTATLDDPDGSLSVVSWLWEHSPDRASWTTVGRSASGVYTPLAGDVGSYLRATASYGDGADAGQSAEAVSAHPVREPRGRHTPVFTDGASTTRRTSKTAPPGVNIGGPLAASDGANDRLSYSLRGMDAASFDIDESFGQLRTRADLNRQDKDSCTVTVSVSDAEIEVTINFGATPVTPPVFIGGGPTGPTPSKVEFEWNVTRDIEELDSGHGSPTDAWSDGTTLWLAENGDGADDAVYAYDLESGKRVEELEFELDNANLAPRGVWSDGDVMYVADASDGKIHSYNMPDAINARLASLTLSDVEIGEFDGGRTEYEGVPADGMTDTTVEAETVQSAATAVIAPADSDEDADGYQVAVANGSEITITVTSSDGSRTKTYRVRLGETEQATVREPWPRCIRGDFAVGFSLVVYEGGASRSWIPARGACT